MVSWPRPSVARRARVFARRQRSIPAMSACTRRWRTWPTRAPSGSRRCAICSASRRITSAAAPRSAPPSSPTRGALADAGSIEDACERWREAIALTGGDIETWLGLASITPDQEEAEQAVESAHEVAPEDERVVAAMERLRAPQVDPAAIEPPADAFDRFGWSAPEIERAEPADAPQIDELLDAFADLDKPAAAAQAAPREPVTAVESSEQAAPVESWVSRPRRWSRRSRPRRWSRVSRPRRWSRVSRPRRWSRGSRPRRWSRATSRDDHAGGVVGRRGAAASGC